MHDAAWSPILSDPSCASPAISRVAHQASGDADLNCVAPSFENLDHCTCMGQEAVKVAGVGPQKQSAGSLPVADMPCSSRHSLPHQMPDGNAVEEVYSSDYIGNACGILH